MMLQRRDLCANAMLSKVATNKSKNNKENLDKIYKKL